MRHCTPFHRSARVCGAWAPKAIPTAVHADSEVQETLLMKSPCVPGGFGVGSTAQVVPLRRSASVPAFVLLGGDEALGLAAAAALMTGSGLPASRRYCRDRDRRHRRPWITSTRPRCRSDDWSPNTEMAADTKPPPDAEDIDVGCGV